jgi:hypothetical protein
MLLPMSMPRAPRLQPASSVSRHSPLFYPESVGRRATRHSSCILHLLIVCAIFLSVEFLSPRPAFSLDPSLDVSQYAHTTWKVRDGFVKGVLTSLAQTPDGYVWVGTESGLYRFDGVRALLWQPPAGQQLPGEIVSNLLTAQDGTLWIGTANGLARWKDGTLTQVPEMAHQIVTSLLQARDGTVWITAYAGSPTGKLCDIRSGVVHCETLAAVMKALYEDSKGAIWVGLQNGVWLWKPGHPEFFSFPDEPIGIISLAEDEQGHLLVGTHAGIQQLVSGRFEPYPSSGSAFRWQVTRMFRDRGLAHASMVSCTFPSRGERTFSLTSMASQAITSGAFLRIERAASG